MGASGIGGLVLATSLYQACRSDVLLTFICVDLEEECLSRLWNRSSAIPSPGHSVMQSLFIKRVWKHTGHALCSIGPLVCEQPNQDNSVPSSPSLSHLEVAQGFKRPKFQTSL